MRGDRIEIFKNLKGRFIYYIYWDISPFYYLLASTLPQKKIFEHNIYNISTDQILLNISSDSFQKCSLNFFFYHYFWNHSIQS